MFEFTEIVVQSINDNRVAPDFSTLDLEWLKTADCLGETEGEETNGSHQTQDDADDSDFLPPRPLSLWCLLSCTALECPIGNTDGEEVAVDHPSVLWTGHKVAQAWAAVWITVGRINFVGLSGVGRSVGL